MKKMRIYWEKATAALSSAAIAATALSCLPLTAGAADTLFHDDFESGKGSWTGRGGASVALSTSAAYQGSGSLYVTDRTDAWNGATKALDESEFVPGKSYSFSSNIMFSTGSSEKFSMTLQYSDGDGKTQYANIASADAESGSWVQIANPSYKIPSDASKMQLYIETASSTMDFYVDEVTAAPDGTEIAGAKPVPFVLGDLNKNGFLDAADLSLMKQGFLAESKDSTFKKYANVDQNNAITAADITMLFEYLTGQRTEFEKGEDIELPKPEIPEGGARSAFEKSYNFPAVSSLKSSNDIPDPFIFQDGSKVESQADWYRRAQEIACMYEYYMYGVWRDGSDDEVSYTISGNKMTINVTRKSTGKKASFPVNVNRPNKVRHEGGAPVIIGMHDGIAESTATSQGYAVLTIGGTIFSNPVAADNTSHTGPFYTLYPYGNSWDEQTGVLMAWSWGCGKILDALYNGAAEELNINPDSSIVTGVSRWGKATAVCGAFDERFKMCAPSCSGAGGLAIYRYKSEGKTYDFSSKGASSSYRYGQNEPLGSLQSTDERGWFNNRFLEFRAENQIPMDQHMLGALCADPNRYMFIIGSCVSEDWVNAPSMWLSYLGMKHVYDYLDLSDHLAINIHKEGHAVIAEDVNYMVQYFDYHVYGLQPKSDLSALQTSVFALPKNADPFFSSFASKWTY